MVDCGLKYLRKKEGIKMEWVNFEYYTDKFRMKAPNPPILEAEFPMLARRAFDIINWKNIDFPNDYEISDKLRDCLCEAIEMLRRNEGATEIRKMVKKRLFNSRYHNDFVSAIGINL